MVDLRLTFWNKWVSVRVERTADGWATWYFGLGRFDWRRRG